MRRMVFYEDRFPSQPRPPSDIISKTQSTIFVFTIDNSDIDKDVLVYIKSATHNTTHV